ncbi:hypothetical protein [Salmonella bongori]|uniref:hypothetical protein n=1 Tax=Salmonella bongori TaxID=54736 RepID=UPI00214F52E6|nr:hypothetical protein [Salmonella bongori]
MKENIFLNSGVIYSELVSLFPIKAVSLLSENIRAMDDSDIVYSIFSEKKWTNIAPELMIHTH